MYVISCLLGDSQDVLSIGDDHSIKLWTLSGETKAILTRGRELDKIFRPRWISPIDYTSRAKHRVREARFLAEKLNLRYIFPPTFWDEFMISRCNRRHYLPPEPLKKMELSAKTIEDDISAACASVQMGKFSFSSPSKVRK